MISIHRIAQIFRERNVDISTQHLMRAIRLFIKEGEGANGKVSIAQGSGAVEKIQKPSVTYQVPEPASALVREEEFAKQLRLARYLAASSLPPSRPLEPLVEGRTPKRVRAVPKARSKAKAEAARKKVEEAELAKERRRAGPGGPPGDAVIWSAAKRKATVFARALKEALELLTSADCLGI